MLSSKTISSQELGVEGFKINHVLPRLTMPDDIKQFLISKMFSISHKILSDETVFMFCVMIIIFNDCQTDIANIRNMYLNMLR